MPVTHARAEMAEVRLLGKGAGWGGQREQGPPVQLPHPTASLDRPTLGREQHGAFRRKRVAGPNKSPTSKEGGWEKPLQEPHREVHPGEF